VYKSGVRNQVGAQNIYLSYVHKIKMGSAKNRNDCAKHKPKLLLCRPSKYTSRHQCGHEFCAVTSMHIPPWPWLRANMCGLRNINIGFAKNKIKIELSNE
jgi:hypothetical protein